MLIERIRWDIRWEIIFDNEFQRGLKAKRLVGAARLSHRPSGFENPLKRFMRNNFPTDIPPDVRTYPYTYIL